MFERNKTALMFVLLLGLSGIFGREVRADEFTSSGFKVLDPVIFSSGFGTSSSYQLLGTVSELAIGTSTITSFGVNSGFLFYPFASSPVVTATAGNGQVALSWTASEGLLGWTASGYNVGKATASGGPYTYGASLGNVLSSTQTGLTNGTAYYFVVRVEDAFGNSIATSTEVSATPAAPAPTPTPTPASGGGGGGGGGGSTSVTAVTFSGRAYPKSTITLLKDAQIAATTVAGTDANFQISVSGLSGGSYIFSVYSEDSKGIRSSLLTFPVSVTSGATTNIGGIFIAPTIAVDKSEVRRGENIAIFGQSVSGAGIIITVNSDDEVFVKTKADNNGMYLYTFDTAQLDLGQHFTKSKAALASEISSFSQAISFTVGTKTVVAQPVRKEIIKGNLNSDNRVNLIDFSIAAYWYKRPDPPKNVDLNGDGKVNLVDFSIMAFYWTG